jgi:transcription initiation factor TFIIA small subunit
MKSIGGTLADTLDDLISSRRIEPQLAIKIMTNFDKAIAQVLGEKVKARMSFKVRKRLSTPKSALLSMPLSLCLVVSGKPAHPLSRRASPGIVWYQSGTDAGSQGHLDTYRFCDDVWTFILKDIKVKLDNSQQIEVEKVRIVSLLNATSAHNGGKK